MGYGDELIATGLARGAAARGKRIAFGNGKRIVLTSQSAEIFRNNPNIARPGEENLPNIEWIPHYQGRRVYATQIGNRWEFHPTKMIPGEIFWSPEEVAFGASFSNQIDVVLEPRVKRHGACVGINKQWPVYRYQQLASMLEENGVRVAQLVPPGIPPVLRKVRAITTPTFRNGLAVLSQARLYIGPEGGLHHGAAAVDTMAIVLFGGFPSPTSTGYDNHINLTGGAQPCGRMPECSHCRAAMYRISVEEVFELAVKQLQRRRVA